MSLCGVCHLDSKKHSKKLWVLHQQTQFCTFCQKSGSEHSEKLWEMHKLAAEKGRYCPDHHKEEKLYPLTVGFARTGIATASTLNADPPVYTHSKSRWEFLEHNYWEFGEEFWHREDQLNPIYMECTECSLYLGSTEEDNADILDGMCLKCFREQTEQTSTWYDIPPVLKSAKDVKNEREAWK